MRGVRRQEGVTLYLTPIQGAEAQTHQTPIQTKLKYKELLFIKSLHSAGLCSQNPPLPRPPSYCTDVQTEGQTDHSVEQGPSWDGGVALSDPKLSRLPHLCPVPALIGPGVGKTGS